MQTRQPESYSKKGVKMGELFCAVCNKQEFSKIPNGKTVKQTSNAIEMICSTCTQHCVRQGFQNPPWGGKEEVKETLEIRSQRQLKRRK